MDTHSGRGAASGAPMAQTQILAAVVNHNTSAYTELMARSLFALHPAPLRFFIDHFRQ